jgi:hypothetical protein
MISFKALALIGESLYLVLVRDWYESDRSTIYVTAVTEFMNWLITQSIIWVVAMRFY